MELESGYRAALAVGFVAALFGLGTGLRPFFFLGVVVFVPVLLFVILRQFLDALKA